MSISRFEINKLNCIASFVYNLPKNNECTICRYSLNSNSLYYQDKGINSYIVIGDCGHAYHQECIKPWVNKNPSCPICFKKWNYKKNTNISKNNKINIEK